MNLTYVIFTRAKFFAKITTGILTDWWIDT